jgi:poly(hydroxyalkanoate) depolymerase family esterase
MQILKQLISSFFAFTFSFSAFASFTTLDNFGANPGDLEVSYYAPQSKNLQIVVLLHGCAQHGEELAQKSGLLGLAKEHNFALLLPQQGLTNNIKRCFNWYSDDDYTKNLGESLSIKNMITALKKKLASDEVYIVGLSGGGAMASSMLVNYPDLFNAGAVIAGIPFPCADGLITGISCMKNGPSQTVDELVSLTKELNLAQKVWPRLSVWTGASDSIVNPLNSAALAQQWASLWQLNSAPTVYNKPGYKVSQWQSNQNKAQVELIEVHGAGHGIMVNPAEKNGGEVSDYLLASPVSTMQHIIKFWLLVE